MLPNTLCFRNATNRGRDPTSVRYNHGQPNVRPTIPFRSPFLNSRHFRELGHRPAAPLEPTAAFLDPPALGLGPHLPFTGSAGIQWRHPDALQEDSADSCRSLGPMPSRGGAMCRRWSVGRHFTASRHAELHQPAGLRTPGAGGRPTGCCSTSTLPRPPRYARDDMHHRIYHKR
ncbi:hypothetical protein NDU88_002361 [Pleurodeles waltl]|uniref:Uncharacterized protein n=1 Tax=Pleurodeles waltl TaxID=8319 RepID=A0AAV7UVD0_PLEWA|nr:hypothetical protein NDU88_002361 [Pleurodeles waltl]